MIYDYHTFQGPHVVVIGGGFGGLELIKKLKNKPFKVTLIDKHNYHTFQPLLYQVASGGLGSDAIAYPFRKVIGPYPNIAFRMGEVTKVDTSNKCVQTNIGTISYDYLVIATGSTTNFFGNEDLANYSMELKSIPGALDLRSELLQEFEKAIITQKEEEQRRILNFIVVGGGPTGVETAGALAEIRNKVLPSDYTEIDPSKMRIHLIEASPRLLATMSEVASAKALKFLRQLGVEVAVDTAVKSYDGHKVVLSTGEEMTTDTVIWAAGVKGATLEGIPETTITKGNRYKVNQYNQLEGFENIFALGDIAYMETAQYPKSHPMVAPVAIQQASLLAQNLDKLTKEQPLASFHYTDKGSMATIGRNKAVVDIGKIRFQGYFAWLVWMFVHLMSLVGFRNRLVVFVNWAWNYVTYDKAIRLIIRPFKSKTSS